MRIFDYIVQGGTIMYILLVINIVGFSIMISKFILLGRESKNTDSTVHKLYNNLKESSHANASLIIESCKKEIALYIEGLEKGLSTVKIIANISPLLGLLGTVLGVLIAFKVMSQTGLSDPSSFAKGISMALITTVGGMIVAIPHYVGHNYLIAMIDSLETKLEKELINKIS